MKLSVLAVSVLLFQISELIQGNEEARATRSFCPAGFFEQKTQEDVKCYKHFNDTLRSWKEANDKCESENLRLANGVHKVTRGYLVRHNGIKYFTWVGARTSFMWLSGEVFFNSYTSFLRPYEKCLGILTTPNYVKQFPGKYLYDFRCDAKMWTLCENIKCPEGFFKSSSTCYKFIENKSNWKAANDACREHGLFLAEPSDPLQLRADLLEIYKRKAGWVWLGARGNGVDIRWQRSEEILPLDSPLLHPQIRGREKFLSSDYCLQTRAEWQQVENFPNEPFYSYLCNGKHKANAVCEGRDNAENREISSRDSKDLSWIATNAVNGKKSN